MIDDDVDEMDDASARNWLTLADGGGLLLRDPAPASGPRDGDGAGRGVRAQRTTSTDPSPDGTWADRGGVSS